ELRQSYRRVAKRAAIKVRRYSHAHQFNRTRRALKFLRTRLSRVIRDIRRKIDANSALEERFGPPRGPGRCASMRRQGCHNRLSATGEQTVRRPLIRLRWNFV